MYIPLNYHSDVPKEVPVIQQGTAAFRSLRSVKEKLDHRALVPSEQV